MKLNNRALIQKLRDDVAKLHAKRMEYQEKEEHTAQKLQEAENTEIVGMVRAEGCTLEQLADLLELLRSHPLPVRPQTDPKKEEPPIESK